MKPRKAEWRASVSSAVLVVLFLAVGVIVIPAASAAGAGDECKKEQPNPQVEGLAVTSGAYYISTRYVGARAFVQSIEGMIQVPNMDPISNEFYYQLYSIWTGSATSGVSKPVYAQVGYASAYGNWQITWAALTDCSEGNQCSNFSWKAGLLQKGHIYNFKMSIAGTQVHYQVWDIDMAWLLVFDMYRSIPSGSGGSFVTEEKTNCLGPSGTNWRAYGYQAYEEVKVMSAQNYPFWNFYYSNAMVGTRFVTATEWRTHFWGAVPDNSYWITISGNNINLYNQRISVSASRNFDKVSVGGTLITGISIKKDQSSPWFTTLSTGFISSVYITVTYSPPSGTSPFTAYVYISPKTGVPCGFHKLRINGATDYGMKFTTEDKPFIVEGCPPSGGGGCVAKNTQVLTPTGSTKVQKLMPFDVVVGYDVATGKTVELIVTSVSIAHQNHWLVFNGKLTVTLIDQPLYVKQGEWVGWVPDPQAIQLGDSLFDPVNGVWVEIMSIEPLHKGIESYDVHTTGPDTYVAEGFLTDGKPG